MIDTIKLADEIGRIFGIGKTNPRGETVWYTINEALAPLLAELERLRERTTDDDALQSIANLEVEVGRLRTENEELGRHLEAVDLRALDTTLRADQDARHRISDREREIEDLAKQLFAGGRGVNQAFSDAELFYATHDRRRAERKAGG